jgi:hypothetical protein
MELRVDRCVCVDLAHYRYRRSCSRVSFGQKLEASKFRDSAPPKIYREPNHRGQKDTPTKQLNTE